jgi:mercuric ion binding protein
MYRLLFCYLLSIAILVPSQAPAGNHDIIIAHYNVNGVCEKCQKRIEDAAYLKGVKYAYWNKDTHDLTLKYDSVKTTPELILQSIAKAGHDSEKYIATEEDYNKLPPCCRYRSGIKSH